MLQYVLSAEKSNCETRNLYLVKIFFRHEGKTDISPNKGKQREIITSRPATQDMLKKFVQEEQKGL